MDVLKPLFISLIIISVVFSSGCTQQEIKACGSSEIISKLPNDIENLEMNKVAITSNDNPVKICKEREIGLSGQFPMMSDYATAEYSLKTDGRNSGIYGLYVLRFENANNATEAMNFLRNELIRGQSSGRTVMVQKFGMNNVYWELGDNYTVKEAVWKSDKYIILIDNRGAQFISNPFILRLLSQFPSDITESKLDDSGTS